MRSNVFACFTGLVREYGALKPGDSYLVNAAQVVLAKEISLGSYDYPRWGGEGPAPEKVYALRFTAGDDLLVLESPWNAGWK